MSKEAFIDYIIETVQNADKAPRRDFIEKVAAKEFGIDNKTDVKELSEYAIVKAAHSIAIDQSKTIYERYSDIVNLYRNQTNLSYRTSHSVMLQQYSTPAPIGFLAGVYCGIDNFKQGQMVFEPSAGNGLLLVALNNYNRAIVNEIDETRAENLKRSGFKEVLRKDASRPFIDFDKKFDAVITNPPFARIPKVIIDTYHITDLDHAMAMYALFTMKDDGKAAIIIGGHTHYDDNGRIKYGKNLRFLHYLYTRYNVEDVIAIDGSALYSRQGTSFDTRLILINGRKRNDKAIPPSQSDLDIPVDDFETLYSRVMSHLTDNTDLEMELEMEALKLIQQQELGLEGIGMPYVPKSKASFSLQVDTPDSMGAEMQSALTDIANKVGDIDEYVRQKLNYPNKTALFKALAAEQIDSVALAIYNMENYNEGVIIADMTGIGKGRQAAALMRYAIETLGKVPIFMTEKPNLFSDMYRDLKDIGSASYVPFILNAKSAKTHIKDADGKIVYRALESKEQKKYIDGITLPRGVDYMVMTYSQLQGGHDVNRKTMTINHVSAKAEFVKHFAEGSILVMDEAHNAAGTSLTGKVMQQVLSKSQGVAYLSATYAKRPDNMFLYALRTSLREASLSGDSFLTAFERGGVALQEVVSAQLVRQGQLIRRQRPYDNVEVNYIYLDERAEEYGMPNKYEEHRAKADVVTSIIRDIINFQSVYITRKVEVLDGDFQQTYGKVELTKGTKEAGVTNSSYFSRVFNVINQLLFAIKAEDVADRAIQRLKEGKKPVIAFASTMEAFVKGLVDDEAEEEEEEDLSGLGALPKDGLVVRADFTSVMAKALRSVMKYTTKFPNGDSETRYFELSELGPQARDEYYRILNRIQSSTTGLTVSPIDLIKQKITSAGYRVAEVTGRKYELELSEVDKKEYESEFETSGRPLTISDIPELVRRFMPIYQQQAIVGSEEHEDILKRLEYDISNLQQNHKMSRETGDTDGIAHVRFWIGDSNWYVTDWDGEDTIFEYTVLNDDWQMAEYGYSSLSEMTSITRGGFVKVEMDFFWTPIEVEKIIRNQGHNGLGGLGDLDMDSEKVIMATVTNRKKETANDAFRQFNNNEVDVLMINQSGATGASAHAIATTKVKVKDVKQRVMIVLQAELDINKEVQKRGRINRTGQLLPPIYDYVISAIPAELRLMMMLQKKLKSLDANTTSSQKSSEDLLKSEDFLNKYGDKVVKSFLDGDRDFADSVGIDPDTSMDLGLAHKTSGRVAILATKEQDAFYSNILADYHRFIKKLIEKGEYDLEVEVMNLQAKTKEKEVMAIGKGGRSAFGDNTYLEISEVNNLRKPLKAEDVFAKVDSALDGKTPEQFIEDYIEELKPDIEARKKRNKEKHENKLFKELEKISNKKANKETTPEQWAEFLKTEADKAKEEALTKINGYNNLADSDLTRIKDNLEYFKIGSRVNVEVNGMNMMGIVTDVILDRKKKAPSLPKYTEIEIAVASSLRLLSFVIHGEDLVFLNAIRGVTGWRSQIPPRNTLMMMWTAAIKAGQSDRVERFIVTGNVLQAFSRGDIVTGGSKLIDYTTFDGKVRKGILLPESYAQKRMEAENRSEKKLVACPIAKARKIIQQLSPNSGISSSDDIVTIMRVSLDKFKIILPLSRSKGGDFYTDTMLLEFLDDEFGSVSGKMVAVFDLKNLEVVTEVLQMNHNVSMMITMDQLRLIEDMVEADKGTDEVTQYEAPEVVLPAAADEDFELELEAEALLLIQEQELALKD